MPLFCFNILLSSRIIFSSLEIEFKSSCFSPKMEMSFLLSKGLTIKSSLFFFWAFECKIVFCFNFFALTSFDF